MARDIAEWLEGLELGRYAGLFAENEITLAALPHITDQDLREMGVALGARRVLLAAIGDSQFAEPNDMRPPERGAAERRHLTIMFCDLVGSTALASRLDPEDMRDVMRFFQDIVSREILRFDGHVAKFMGDGVLAYFGYPRAHEDDAERAVRAGLSIIAEVSAPMPEIGDVLQVRLGVATGSVVVGDLIGEGAAQEEVVVGHTPNLAARLQEAAAPNTLLIAAETYELAGPAFACRDMGKVSFKGLADDVTVWRVDGERHIQSRFEARTSGELTAIVGRDKEVAHLLDRWRRACGGAGQLVVLGGEAGIGKSRILDAVRQRLSAEPQFQIRYQCSPYFSNSALYPVIAQLNHAAKMTPEDETAERLTKVERLVLETDDDRTETLQLFAALLSVPFEDRYGTLSLTPQQQMSRTLTALVKQLLALAARRPVLFLIEDAHWIDPTTQEMVGQMAAAITSGRVLVVVTHRPDYDAPWDRLANATNLTLRRLSRAQAMAMVDALAADNALPPEVLAQIIDKTDGVPLFVEELTKTVLESDVAAGRVEPLAVPATLQDSLMARLDRSATAKDVAQIGAVIGRRFDYVVLAALSPLTTDQLDQALAALEAFDIVHARGKPPAVHYMFKHALVQDAAYESLLRSSRLQLHARIAAVLAERGDAEPEYLAHHYTEAGLGPQAIEQWQRAAQSALARSASAEAVAHLEKSLTLLLLEPPGLVRDQQELSLLLALGVPVIAAKGYGSDDVERVYLRARDLAEQLGEREHLFTILRGLWNCYLERGHLERSYEFAEQLIGLGDRLESPINTALAFRASGTTLLHMGRWDEARVALGRSLEARDHHQGDVDLAMIGEDPRPVSGMYLGWALTVLGYPEQGGMAAAEARRAVQDIDSPLLQAFVGTIAGFVLLMCREHAKFEEGLADALAIAHEHELVSWIAIDTWARGHVTMELGDSEQGLALMETGWRQWNDVGAHVSGPFWLSGIADAYRVLERPDEAFAAFDQAFALAARNGDRWAEAELHRKFANLLKAVGRDNYEIEGAFERALRTARSQNAKLFELRATVDLVRYRLERGRGGETRALLEPIYAWFSEGFERPDLVEAKALLDSLR
jgi:class 3 adenylate cyclase/tetratricopeptide (TPR) repeat protein